MSTNARNTAPDFEFTNSASHYSLTLLPITTSFIHIPHFYPGPDHANFTLRLATLKDHGPTLTLSLISPDFLAKAHFR